MLSRAASGIVYALGGRTAPVPAVTEEEMKAMVEAGVEEGAIEQEEQKLIHSIFEFADTTVREVMVPRVDMVCVEASMSMEEILEVFAEKKFSRMPVYDETVDNVVGVIHIKNILNFWRRQITDMKAMEFVVFPHFVPETKKVIELLEEFRHKQLHMAIVVDEYGGTAGLVTMEDLIEEIVGEIEDEHHRPAPPIRQLEDGSYVADARVEVDHLNEMLSLDLPKGEFETVGGLLYHRLGKIPARGEQMELGGVRITVLDGDARRIRRVKVEVTRRDEDENLSPE
jgi:CBS domain containing-hemolysin-like protein